MCATGTDARSSTSQQQQQIPQLDHQQQEPAAAPRWDIKMLYDGDCPLCMREVHGLDASIFCVLVTQPKDASPQDHA